MNHLSQKKLYGLAYQWIMAKEAASLTDDDAARIADAVIVYLRFVKQTKPYKKHPSSSL